MVAAIFEAGELEWPDDGAKIRHDDLPVTDRAVEEGLPYQCIRGRILEDARAADAGAADTGAFQQFAPTPDGFRMGHVHRLGVERDLAGTQPRNGGETAFASRDLQQQDRFFDGVFCRAATTVNLSVGGEPTPTAAEIVSGSYFSVLGVNPALGRLIDGADDGAPGANPVVVLSHDFWKTRLSGVPGIVGHVDRNAFFGSEREFEAWRQGRFDIGSRKWHGGEPKVAVRTPPPTPAGLRAPHGPVRVPGR